MAARVREGNGEAAATKDWETKEEGVRREQDPERTVGTEQMRGDCAC